jgi:hypothetical protein
MLSLQSPVKLIAMQEDLKLWNKNFQAKEKCSLYDPTVVVTLSTNQLSSCLDSLTIDDLYPCVTINGVSISGELNHTIHARSQDS